jgi:hypothetical protein
MLEFETKVLPLFSTSMPFAVHKLDRHGELLILEVNKKVEIIETFCVFLNFRDAPIQRKSNK